MDIHLINEIFRLLVISYKHNPKQLVALFDESESVAAFDFDASNNQFICLSKSVRRFLGFKNVFLMGNESAVMHLIHPEDCSDYARYFRQKIPTISSPNNSFPLLQRMRCRMRHIKGYWKHLIFISFDYKSENETRQHKIGLIADELKRPVFSFDQNDNNTLISQDHFNAPELKNVSVTPREHEILDLIGQGFIAKEIANKLNISITTVISHRKNLITKFRAKNTAELIRYASRLMII